jgi:c-di-GMP-binding flagellar brake protein YcgR
VQPIQTERRKSHRIEMPPDEGIRIEVRHRVELLDISMSGALMACAVKLPLGTRGRFHAGLGSKPFSADVVIRRHHARHAPHTQVGLAAIFSSMDQRSREHLEQFLRRGSD